MINHCVRLFTAYWSLDWSESKEIKPAGPVTKQNLTRKSYASQELGHLRHIHCGRRIVLIDLSNPSKDYQTNKTYPSATISKEVFACKPDLIVVIDICGEV